MVTPQQQGVFIPADMPRDRAGNVAYKVGNFFKDVKHPDGLPRPRRRGRGRRNPAWEPGRAASPRRTRSSGRVAAHSGELDARHGFR